MPLATVRSSLTTIAATVTVDRAAGSGLARATRGLLGGTAGR